VGPSDRLFSRQYVKKNEDLILIKFQTPLKRKYNLFCLTETRVFIQLELIMALKLASENCPLNKWLKFTRFNYVNQKGCEHE